MTVQVNSLQFWFQTRDAIVENLTMALKAQQDADASTDPDSPFQKAHAAVTQCFADLHALAVSALKQIDVDIGTSGLIAQIGTLAAQAKTEADRIAAVTHTIEDISNAVDLATSVVTKIAALPFL